ncbi:hypothetical protein N751_01070 [Legionella pneumophila str. Leg01/11]|nr:hypothetical protein N751_01070 [Legionella pneumophila str. Leg01/11]ERI48915.1 hypothetical protein N749_08155 [Legionella pneumophila str. Leg01/20]
MHQAILSGVVQFGIDYKEDLYKKQFMLATKLTLRKPYISSTHRVNPC